MVRRALGLLFAFVVWVIAIVSHWGIHAAAWLMDREEEMKDCFVCNERRG